MLTSFCKLASVAGGNVLGHVSCQVGPVEPPLHQLSGVVSAHVSSNQGARALNNDLLSEVRVVRHIDLIFREKDTMSFLQVSVMAHKGVSFAGLLDAVQQLTKLQGMEQGV